MILTIRRLALAALATTATITCLAAQPPAPVPVSVFKSPTCGCCAKWNDHLTAAGFAVTSKDETDMNAVKDQRGVPPALRSCHTAVVAGYVIEGHVPADVVRRLLRERPAGIAGLAVPGMPAGSPGMEMPDGRKDAYDVVAFDTKGTTSVYAKK
jgi:hypothetical protein